MDEKEKEEGQGTPAPTVEDLQKKIAELTQERDNVVGELKEDRKARQTLQEQIEELKGKLEKPQAEPEPVGNDPAAIAAQVYKKMREEERASMAKSNRVAAIERFVRENPEFNPANDTTGKRREALEEKLKMFNTSNFETVDQFYSAVRDASRLLGAHTASTDSEADTPSPFASDVPPTTTPKPAGQDGLSDKERKLIQQNGMTVERYKKLKESMPDTVADLLERVK